MEVMCVCERAGREGNVGECRRVYPFFSSCGQGAKQCVYEYPYDYLIPADLVVFISASAIRTSNLDRQSWETCWRWKPVARLRMDGRYATNEMDGHDYELGRLCSLTHRC